MLNTQVNTEVKQKQTFPHFIAKLKAAADEPFNYTLESLYKTQVGSHFHHITFGPSFPVVELLTEHTVPGLCWLTFKDFLASLCPVDLQQCVVRKKSFCLFVCFKCRYVECT